MDTNTFTNSLAAQHLVHILSQPEYECYKRRVNTILSRWFQYSATITSSISDPTIARGTLDMWRTCFIERLGEAMIPEVVYTHARNVLTIQYRRCKEILDQRASVLASMKREGIGRKVAPIGHCCPHCGADVWYLGPCGGLSQNVKCTKCGQCYNDMAGMGFEAIEDNGYWPRRSYKHDTD